MANRPLWAQKQSVFTGAVGTKVASFSGELTSTTILTAVAAVTGKKIRVRAFNINAMVSVVLAAASGPSIALVDSTYLTGVLYQLTSFGKTAAITTVPFSTGLVILPLDGAVRETTAGNALKIAQSVDLSTGVIAVSGTVYYDEI